jgi:hypothetical protein
MVEIQRGQPHHLFLGHGLKQEYFEVREFATTTDLAYEQKQTTDQIVHPKVFQSDAGKTRSQMAVNADEKDAPAIFKYGQQKVEPKSYN